MNSKKILLTGASILMSSSLAQAVQSGPALMHCQGTHHSYIDVIAENESFYIKSYSDADEEEAPARYFHITTVEKDHQALGTLTESELKNLLNETVRGESHVLLKAQPPFETNDLAVMNLNTFTGQSFYVSPAYDVQELNCRIP